MAAVFGISIADSAVDIVPNNWAAYTAQYLLGVTVARFILSFDVGYVGHHHAAALRDASRDCTYAWMTGGHMRGALTTPCCPPPPSPCRFHDRDKTAMIIKVRRSNESCMLITFRTQTKGASDFKGDGAPHAVLQLLNGEGATGTWEHIASFGANMAGGGERKQGMVFFNTRFAEDHGFDVSWLLKL